MSYMQMRDLLVGDVVTISGIGGPRKVRLEASPTPCEGNLHRYEFTFWRADGSEDRGAWWFAPDTMAQIEDVPASQDDDQHETIASLETE